MSIGSSTRSRAQALVEFALIAPVLFGLFFLQINAALLTHQWTVVRDTARVGWMLGMDTRMVTPSCDPACATAIVRDEMKMIGAQAGIGDANIHLGKANCSNIGEVWNDTTGWRSGQEYSVCVTQDYRPFGPWMPEGLFHTTAELKGRRI